MTSEEIKKRVIRVLREQLGVKEEELQPEAMLADDLAADSLDMIEICMSMEEEFEIEIPEEEFERSFTSVGSIIAFIERIHQE